MFTNFTIQLYCISCMCVHYITEEKTKIINKEKISIQNLKDFLEVSLAKLTDSIFSNICIYAFIIVFII